MVCSPKPEIVLKLDTGKVKVKDLRDDILIKALNMVNPDVMVDGKGIILISSEEGETDCNNEKILKDLSIVDGCVLKVDDFFQSYELTITIIHKDFERDDSGLFEVIADPSLLKPETNGSKVKPSDTDIADAKEDDSVSPAKKPKLSEVNTADDSDDDLCVIEDDDVEFVQDTPTTGAGSSSSNSSDTAQSAGSSLIRSPPKKRKPAGLEVEQGPSAKRSKVLAEQEDDDDLICIDDD